MGNEESAELTPELLNDFYAECEEHLSIVRQSLVALDAGMRAEEIPAKIEKLFRSVHSLKGMMGIAGIRSAEELTHRAEDYLRDLSRNARQLTPEGIDLLVRTVQLLDATILAFRQHEQFPDVNPLVAEYDVFLVKPPETPSHQATRQPEGLETKIEEASLNGLSVWKATFVPSSALNERGINVNAIRGRLSALGEIIHAAPQIGAQGAVTFEFYFALAGEPTDLPGWEKEGVKLEQVAKASPTAQRTPALATQLASVAPSQLIRVELHRLDELMRITGELVIQRARLEEHINQLAARDAVDVRTLQEINAGFARHFRDLRDAVMRLRMVSIGEIFDRMPFVVRDLTRGSSKKVNLDVHGQSTELDKFVVERLKDPLLHLVRNAISHGIENSEERIAKGKPAEATLRLSASASGETVVIEIADDGRGIDPAKIVQRAKKMGIPVSETLDAAGILDLISTPGFSTRKEADHAAGRGVGMAVVVNTVRELGGSLLLDTEANRGTRFTMRLPLTLLITDALIISSGDQKFAVPQSSVEQVVQIEEGQVKRMERAELLSLRGTVLPLVRLRAAFGFPPATNPRPPVLVSETDRGRIGLVVDRIIGQRQIVVRSVRDPLIHVPGVIGATELGDGRPLLILDAAALAKQNGGAKLASRALAGDNGENERTL